MTYEAAKAHAAVAAVIMKHAWKHSQIGECVSVGLTLIIAWLWFTPRSRAQHSLVQPAVAGATQ